MIILYVGSVVSFFFIPAKAYLCGMKCCIEVYYELYFWGGTQEILADYTEILLVCVRASNGEINFISVKYGWAPTDSQAK